MPHDQYVLGRPWYVENRSVPLDQQTLPDDLRTWTIDSFGQEVAQLYQERWGSIRSHFWETTRGIRSVYNCRISGPDTDLQTLDNFIDRVALRCSMPFTINASLSCILRSTAKTSTTNNSAPVYRFFHGSEQNGSLYDRPRDVTSQDDIHDIIQDIRQRRDHLIQSEHSEAWTNVTYTNISIYIHHIVMGGGDDDIENNTNEDGVIRVSGEDNLCLFRCLAIHRNSQTGEFNLEASAREYAEASNIPIVNGITLDRLPHIEDTFQISIDVIQLVGGVVYEIVKSIKPFPKGIFDACI